MDLQEGASDTSLLLGLERTAIAMASYLQRLLAALTDRERELPRGESLFRDGDPVESLFVVMSGELRVTCLLPHGMELTLQRAPAGARCNVSSMPCGSRHVTRSSPLITTNNDSTGSPSRNRLSPRGNSRSRSVRAASRRCR